MSWDDSNMISHNRSMPSSRLSSLRERLRYSGAIHSSRSAISRGDGASDEVIVDVGLNRQATYVEHLLARMEQHGLRRCPMADEDITSYTVAPFAENDDKDLNDDNKHNNNNSEKNVTKEREADRAFYYYICVPCEMRLTRVSDSPASLRMLDDVHYHFASASHRQCARWMADPDIDQTLLTSSLLTSPSNTWTRIYVNGTAVLLSRRPGGGEMFYSLPHEEYRVKRPTESARVVPRITQHYTKVKCDVSLHSEAENEYKKKKNCNSHYECREDVRSSKKRKVERNTQVIVEGGSIIEDDFALSNEDASLHLPLFPVQQELTYWFAPIHNFFTQSKQLTVIPSSSLNRCNSKKGHKCNDITHNTSVPKDKELIVEHIPLNVYVENTKLPVSRVPLYPILLRIKHCKIRKSCNNLVYAEHTESLQETNCKAMEHTRKDCDARKRSCAMESTYDDDASWHSVYTQDNSSPLLEWNVAETLGKRYCVNSISNNRKTINDEENDAEPQEEELLLEQSEEEWKHSKEHERREKQYYHRHRLERCEVEHDGVYRLCLHSETELKLLKFVQSSLTQEHNNQNDEDYLQWWKVNTNAHTDNDTTDINQYDNKIYTIHTNASSTITTQPTVCNSSTTEISRTQVGVLTQELLDTVPVYLPFKAYHSVASDVSGYLNDLSMEKNDSDSEHVLDDRPVNTSINFVSDTCNNDNVISSVSSSSTSSLSSSLEEFRERFEEEETLVTREDNFL